MVLKLRSLVAVHTGEQYVDIRINVSMASKECLDGTRRYSANIFLFALIYPTLHFRNNRCSGTRAGLKGMGARGNFYLRAPMT